MYCIRSDYIEHDLKDSETSQPRSYEWTPWRLRASSSHQYAVYRNASSLAKELSAKTIVDVGCGPATKLLGCFDESFDLYGIDQASMVEYCQNKGMRGTYLSEDLESPSYKLLEHVASPDMIICADVIEHLIQPDILLDYFHHIAGPSCHIVISTPERESLLGNNAKRPSNRDHVREWSFDEFHSYIEQSGFQILRHDRVLPLRLRPDLLTAKFAIERVIRRLPWDTTQVIVCQTSNNQKERDA